ncbi:hypothetical protein SDC9_126083 [bioreactor metagenome]|uniref:Uncharacterized protein n=1 Tax=bioreactor metagenome TaxID=1076179 RepID=A0A645CQQ6_9ZZZZ
MCDGIGHNARQFACGRRFGQCDAANIVDSQSHRASQGHRLIARCAHINGERARSQVLEDKAAISRGNLSDSTDGDGCTRDAFAAYGIDDLALQRRVGYVGTHYRREHIVLSRFEIQHNANLSIASERYLDTGVGGRNASQLVCSVRVGCCRCRSHRDAHSGESFATGVLNHARQSGCGDGRCLFGEANHAQTVGTTQEGSCKGAIGITGGTHT